MKLLTFRNSLFAGAITVSLVSLSMALAGQDMLHHGVVKNIETTQIVLTTASNEMTFVIHARTQISLDGKPAKATDLMAGDTAMVMAPSAPANTAVVDFPLATRIDAMRGSTPGSPDPIPYSSSAK